MGLDSVELVMNVEDHFGISFTASECLEVRTVGDLVEVCRQRIAASLSKRCFTLPCFLSLRREVRAVTADPSFRIRPSQRIVDRLSPYDRRALWRRLAAVGEGGPNKLRRPRILTICIWLTAAFASGMWMVVVYNHREWNFLSVIVGLITLLVLFAATRIFKTEPPASLATFGDMARWIASWQVALKPTESADPAVILNELRPIISELLGVSLDEIVPAAAFVEDLGMD